MDRTVTSICEQIEVDLFAKQTGLNGQPIKLYNHVYEAIDYFPYGPAIFRKVNFSESPERGA